MSDPHLIYDNPLIARYASAEMSALWGPRRKFGTWRRLWVALAEAEAELGLAITPEQIAELKEHVDDIDFEAADRYERRLRHDVMAHVHAYGDVCPKARPIIHLGATSCYVTDNTDLLLLRDALVLVRQRLVAVLERLAAFAREHRKLACLAFTHMQPAQPTTIGKRACLWAYDLVLDLAEIEHRLLALKALGSKGTTGTQASFLELFHGDHAKVRRLEQLVIAGGPPDPVNIFIIQVLGEIDDVRYAGVDEMSHAQSALKRDSDVHAQAGGAGELDLDRVFLRLCMDGPGERFKVHVLFCDLFKKRKSSRAPRAVPAHLSLAPVGVEEPPLEVRLLRRHDHDQAIGSHRVVPVTDLHCKVLQVHPFQDIPAVIDQEKIITASMHLMKRYFLHNKHRREQSGWREAFSLISMRFSLCRSLPATAAPSRH